MNSSAKIMKANGIIHIIHGAILALFTLNLMITISALSFNTGFGVSLLTGGIAFLYIFIGYVLYKLQQPNKVKGFLITSIVFACIEMIYALSSSQMAGIFFIVEFVMDIVCLCNLDAYRKYLKSLNKKSHKKSR